MPRETSLASALAFNSSDVHEWQGSPKVFVFSRYCMSGDVRLTDIDLYGADSLRRAVAVIVDG